MKIEIEFENSYEAKLTIDGKSLKVDSYPGKVVLKGLDDKDYTLGGQIASTLYPIIAKIQQAWATVEEEDPGEGTWGDISENTVTAVNSRLW